MGVTDWIPSDVAAALGGPVAREAGNWIVNWVRSSWDLCWLGSDEAIKAENPINDANAASRDSDNAGNHGSGNGAANGGAANGGAANGGSASGAQNDGSVAANGGLGSDPHSSDHLVWYWDSASGMWLEGCKVIAIFRRERPTTIFQNVKSAGWTGVKTGGKTVWTGVKTVYNGVGYVAGTVNNSFTQPWDTAKRGAWNTLSAGWCAAKATCKVGAAIYSPKETFRNALGFNRNSSAANGRIEWTPQMEHIDENDDPDTRLPIPVSDFYSENVERYLVQLPHVAGSDPATAGSNPRVVLARREELHQGHTRSRLYCQPKHFLKETDKAPILWAMRRDTIQRERGNFAGTASANTIAAEMGGGSVESGGSSSSTAAARSTTAVGSSSGPAETRQQPDANAPLLSGAFPIPDANAPPPYVPTTPSPPAHWQPSGGFPPENGTTGLLCFPSHGQHVACGPYQDIVWRRPRQKDGSIFMLNPYDLLFDHAVHRQAREQCEIGRATDRFFPVDGNGLGQNYDHDGLEGWHKVRAAKRKAAAARDLTTAAAVGVVNVAATMAVGTVKLGRDAAVGATKGLINGAIGTAKLGRDAAVGAKNTVVGTARRIWNYSRSAAEEEPAEPEEEGPAEDAELDQEVAPDGGSEEVAPDSEFAYYEHPIGPELPEGWDNARDHFENFDFRLHPVAFEKLQVKEAKSHLSVSRTLEGNFILEGYLKLGRAVMKNAIVHDIGEHFQGYLCASQVNVASAVLPHFRIAYGLRAQRDFKKERFFEEIPQRRRDSSELFSPSGVETRGMLNELNARRFRSRFIQVFAGKKQAALNIMERTCPIVGPRQGQPQPGGGTTARGQPNHSYWSGSSAVGRQQQRAVRQGAYSRSSAQQSGHQRAHPRSSAEQPGQHPSGQQQHQSSSRHNFSTSRLDFSSISDPLWTYSFIGKPHFADLKAGQNYVTPARNEDDPFIINTVRCEHLRLPPNHSIVGRFTRMLQTGSTYGWGVRPGQGSQWAIALVQQLIMENKDMSLIPILDWVARPLLTNVGGLALQFGNDYGIISPGMKKLSFKVEAVEKKKRNEEIQSSLEEERIIIEDVVEEGDDKFITAEEDGDGSTDADGSTNGDGSTNTDTESTNTDSNEIEI